MTTNTEDPMKAGIPANTFMGDPRINAAQMKAIERATRSDQGARVLGLDRKLRPVVRAHAGIPREPRTWSLLRNGDIGEPDTLLEEWS